MCANEPRLSRQQRPPSMYRRLFTGSENLMKMDVFYGELKYVQTQQKKAYTIVDFLSKPYETSAGFAKPRNVLMYRFSAIKIIFFVIIIFFNYSNLIYFFIFFLFTSLLYQAASFWGRSHFNRAL